MEVNKLKRDATKVHSSLKKLKDGSVIAVKPVEIHIPARYTESELAVIGNVVEYVAIYAIVSEGYYGVSTTCATVRSVPSDTKTVTIEGVEYLIFMFDVGDVVFRELTVVKIDTLAYYIWNEFIDKGRTPWFMESNEINRLMLTAGTHAGANLGKNYSIIELINSVRIRNAKDRTEHIRYSLNAGKNPEQVVIGLRNVQLTVETTSARIGGSYAETGLSAALLNTSDTAEGLEAILLE